MKTYQVTITSSGKSFTVNEGENILVAALRQGVMLPYSCKNGTCGSCKGKVSSGEVHYPFHPPIALERKDYAEGLALMCQAEPLSMLLIVPGMQPEHRQDVPLRIASVSYAAYGVQL